MPEQSPGTVTFHFSDIEGSTRLWETEPTRMADALAHHDRLCRTAVETHGGRLVKMTGDGWQLHYADLPLAFPALRSLDSTPNNLPRQLTSFIGREQEIEQIESLFTRTPLLTLTGAGGGGKTRLAPHVAAGLAAAAAASSDLLRAARNWGTAERLGEELSAPLKPRERPRHDRLVAFARAAHGDGAEFNAAWADGRAMPLEALILDTLATPRA